MKNGGGRLAYAHSSTGVPDNRCQYVCERVKLLVGIPQLRKTAYKTSRKSKLRIENSGKFVKL